MWRAEFIAVWALRKSKFYTLHFGPLCGHKVLARQLHGLLTNYAYNG